MMKMEMWNFSNGLQTISEGFKVSCYEGSAKSNKITQIIANTYKAF